MGKEGQPLSLEEIRLEEVKERKANLLARLTVGVVHSPIAQLYLHRSGGKKPGEIAALIDFPESEFEEAAYLGANYFLPYFLVGIVRDELELKKLAVGEGIEVYGPEADSQMLGFIQNEWGVELTPNRLEAYDQGKREGLQAVFNEFQGFPELELKSVRNLGIPLLPSAVEGLGFEFIDDDKEEPSRVLVVATL